MTEQEERLCRYTVQLMPPEEPNLKCPSTTATAAVRIAGEKECRVLFVQGALTWDYKFIRLAVGADPTIRLSALSRTANQAAFFESSDNDQDLAGGFPATIEELAKFRVVVISNLRPGDLTAGQQQVLSQFCGQYGGGVLMIGGPDTFNASWQASRLEQLLPVRFAPPRPAFAAGPAYRLQVTDAALAHPVFQISDADDNRACWSRLPSFPQYAAVESLKPGARCGRCARPTRRPCSWPASALAAGCRRSSACRTSGAGGWPRRASRSTSTGSGGSSSAIWPKAAGTR